MWNKHLLLVVCLFLSGFFSGNTQAQTLIEGFIFEAGNHGYLNQVKVTVFELPDNLIRGEVETDPDGHFVFELPPGNYRVQAFKEDFFEKNDTLKLGKEKVFLKIEMRRRSGDLFDATDVDKRIQIQNIYYDYGKWDIRPDAAERLDNVVSLMKDNPGISVELGSHTDSRGNDDYNQKLSHRRAAAAVAYIVSEGVDSVRITARGYGEAQLVNRCHNGVECTEEAHQQNRRTELHITGISEKTSWKSLPQIIEDKELERANKAKSPRQKRFQEANTSIPLPTLKLEPDALAEVRILQLPLTFKGCAIELARSEVELPANHKAFQGQKEVFRLLENDGKFTYLIANLGPRDAATAFFKKKVKPVNKTAKLVLYTEGGKEYLSE